MFTALWRAKTMPVKIAAVRATPSDRTPRASISCRIRRKYEGGSARLRSTRPARSATPPYHNTLRVRTACIWFINVGGSERRSSPTPPTAFGCGSCGSYASFGPEAVHESCEVGLGGGERGRRGHVHEVVDAAIVRQHDRLDSHAGFRALATGVEDGVSGRPPRDRDLAVLEHRAIPDPHQQLPRQQTRPSPTRGAVTGCIGGDDPRRRAVPELQIRGTVGDGSPALAGNRHSVALG